MPYKKHFVPLESDPEIFTGLMRDLGVSDILKFIDIWSIQDQAVPGPIVALIVIFPDKNIANASISGFRRSDAERELANEVLWFEQTINNACGLYATLHAVCNGMAKEFILRGSVLDKVVDSCQLLGPSGRPKVIEESEPIQIAYSNAALKGSTKVPEATEEVECHYVCFTKASGNALWLLDGDRDGPLESSEATRLDGGILEGAGLGFDSKVHRRK